MSRATGTDRRAPSSAFPWFGSRVGPMFLWPTDTILSDGRMPRGGYTRQVWRQVICRPEPYALWGLSCSALHEWCVACAGLYANEADLPGGATCAALLRSLTQLRQWRFFVSGSLQASFSASKALVRPSHNSWGGVAAWGIPGAAFYIPSATVSLHR